MILVLGLLFLVDVAALLLLLFWIYDDLRMALDDHRAREFLRNHRQ